MNSYIFFSSVGLEYTFQGSIRVCATLYNAYTVAFDLLVAHPGFKEPFPLPTGVVHGWWCITASYKNEST